MRALDERRATRSSSASRRAEEGVDTVLARKLYEEEVKHARGGEDGGARRARAGGAERGDGHRYQIKTVENQIANTQKRMAALDAQHAKGTGARNSVRNWA